MNDSSHFHKYFLGILLLCLTSIVQANNTFIALSYHDCQDLDSQSFIDTISSDQIEKQFQWLRENGYHPVSIEDLLAAQKGVKPLPEKAILLTFDDGYESFYRVVYPLLKTYQFPAVLAIVGSWIETKSDQKVLYGNKKVSREKFLTWKEIKEISDSGLVEIASHSYDQHHGILANPQNNEQPAFTTRQYFKDKNHYETRSEYELRVDHDLQKNSALLENKLGKRPRVMVWPYGRYNSEAIHLAKKNGMPLTITLDERVNQVDDLSQIGRYYYVRERNLDDFVADLRDLENPKPPIVRSIRIDMDALYDPDPIQCEKNLSQLIERIFKYKVNAVFLQGFADLDAKGFARELYFPNRHLPMKSDLMNRVAWQLFTRGGVSVYAWLPITAFDLKEDKLLVKRLDPLTGKVEKDPDQYERASVFSEDAKQKIREIYEDLAIYVPLSGIAFHDDGVLSDFEDASAAGIEAQQKAGFPASIVEIHQDSELLQRWTRWKSKALIDFSLELIEIVKKYRPLVKSNRNIFALPVLQPESEEWFAQNMDDFLNAYDFVALMAMPYMENHASDPDAWLLNLVEKVKQHPKGLVKTLFEMQTVRWDENNTPIDSETLLNQMRLLSSKGVRNLGYYPDDFYNNHPDIAIVKEGLSVQDTPSIK